MAGLLPGTALPQSRCASVTGTSSSKSIMACKPGTASASLGEDLAAQSVCGNGNAHHHGRKACRQRKQAFTHSNNRYFGATHTSSSASKVRADRRSLCTVAPMPPVSPARALSAAAAVRAPTSSFTLSAYNHELLPDGQQKQTAIVWNDAVLAQHDIDAFTCSHARPMMTCESQANATIPERGQGGH
ncbi:MAG: hypothetical protein FRX49_04369 [Trebouxia sp. A1-2]|nr:MAG: hypothetical protein FRX49_04369 [Trebouxia sp. A1-2]